MIRSEGGKETQVYVVYRSPNSSPVNDSNLNNWINRLNGYYIICGDFNYPGIDWQNQSSDAKRVDFLDAVQSKFLWQHVEGGTHNSENVLVLNILGVWARS